MSTDSPTFEPERASDGLEPEDTGPNAALVKPWDPRKIRITTKSFTLREVVDQIGEGDIELAPDFQREFVWKQRQRTRLIESILLGIPLPAFYFNQDTEGKFQVVDGVQRLSTIRDFMGGLPRLAVDDLEYLKELDGNAFNDLDPALLRRLRTTQIVVHVIEPQTPEDIKYDIFSRVNTLGEPLSAQEIRHAMSKARSRKFLKGLVQLPSFDRATCSYFFRKGSGEPVRDSKRMADRELVLRFCAFRVAAAAYRQSANLDAFLVDFTRRIDGAATASDPLTDDDLDDLATAFDRAMLNAHAILGEEAFRRVHPETGRRGPMNRAIFEAQSIALSTHSFEVLEPHADDIKDAFLEAFDDPDYLKAVTVATGDPVAVDRRLSTNRRLVAEIVR
ncbi:DUF262 domain-containing protein [Thiohalocapsa sp. ML1]|jgi:hypothetical protein|uniref:DUF262 domain-containing protein n=1 Tax=Thiohalocapsa sp. ML1 TaxID=1431688 RepID=UPI0007321BBE|nr:DUF262 domain-containing protein [Thiohalocapsa sp. ML1]